jgi:adenylate cyclase
MTDIQTQSLDSGYIDRLNASAWEQRSELTKKSLEQSQTALNLSQNQLYTKGMAEAMRNIGVCEYLLSNYDTALSESFNAIGLFYELNDKQGEANAFNTIGNVYQSLGDYANALDYHSKALAIRREFNDEQGESASLNNIGNIYQKLGDFTSALEYLQKSLELKRRINDKSGEGMTLLNMGNVYMAQDDASSAIEHFQKSLDIARPARDQRGAANALLNIGSFYHSMGDNGLALDYQLEAFDIFKVIEDKNSIVRTLNNIGFVLNSNKDYDTAQEYLQSALVIAEEINSKELIYDACKGLSESAELKGDFKTALEYNKLYHQFKEEVYNDDVNRKLRGLQTKFGVERVEQEKEIYRLKNVELKSEQEKSERLLLNILPKAIAERLKQGEYVIADHFKTATVLFADIVGFTAFSSRFSPETLITILNEVFSAFDAIIEDYDLEKIKTIGDAYMAVGGVPRERVDHAEAVADAAIKMMEEMKRIHNLSGLDIQIRIGIHSGEVIAGVIGTKKFIYDLWGDTVNIASRMESHSTAGEIQMTEATYKLLRSSYVTEPRGAIEVKGRGSMQTYFLKEKVDWA